MIIEKIRWVLEEQIKTGVEGWFSLRTSHLKDNEVVMVWARSNDGELEPARVMHRITKFDDNNEALYALRFEEE
jgi:hypothetical protein